jgi:hypothetical protein
MIAALRAAKERESGAVGGGVGSSSSRVKAEPGLVVKQELGPNAEEEEKPIISVKPEPGVGDGLNPQPGVKVKEEGATRGLQEATVVKQEQQQQQQQQEDLGGEEPGNGAGVLINQPGLFSIEPVLLQDYYLPGFYLVTVVLPAAPLGTVLEAYQTLG